LVLLAVILVTAIQLVTQFGVLREVMDDQQRQADTQVKRAAVVFDQYMRSRTELLTGLIGALVYDFSFRSTVADGDLPTIRSLLANHAGRVKMETAAIFNLEGALLASVGGGGSLWPGAAMERLAIDSNAPDPVIAIGFIEGKPYHTVTLPINAPVPIAWVTLGMPIDGRFGASIKELTGLESTIVGFGVDRKVVYATTLDDTLREEALANVRLGGGTNSAEIPVESEWRTELKPYHDDADGVFVALQLPMSEVLRQYGSLRDRLLGFAAVALLLAMAAAVWLSRMVTSPVSRLVEAARRMAEGIYNQRIEVNTDDEFAVLAQGFNFMQEAIARREQDIVHMAHHDSLSGLPTREIVVSEISDEIADNDQLAIINFVLHRFDEIASSLGHRTADRLIQLIAGRLRDQLQDRQILGHLNHQEFVLVLPGADLLDAKEQVHELQATLRSGIAVGNANISLQVRAGVSMFPDHGINASELLRCAGIARGLASHHLGSIGIYEPGQEARSLELIRIVGDFPRALRNRELWVEFQPKIDCDSLSLSGAEALVRWEHPDLGRLSPATFIEAIEQAGGISQLTRWVLEETARTIAEWRTRKLGVPVSVNISADDLIDNYLPRFLQRLWAQHGLEPKTLTLEVTESAIMHNVESSLAVIAQIRDLGFRISIDDFGTGHSALAQLKRLPVDELKIDQSFVLNIDDQRDEAVVRMAIELAHKFGLSAVAEGVESEACLTRLQQLGCETAQGFFFSRSLKPDDFFVWASGWSRADGADILTLVKSGSGPRRARK
jgi:diguanylate cyclase (GGDEF)-like protein